jgi:plasmid stability protein
MNSGPKYRGRTRAERLQIMLTADELVLVDDFRFQKRMPSRASAVREILRRGLAVEGFTKALAGSKSRDFGVSAKAPGRQTVKEELVPPSRPMRSILAPTSGRAVESTPADLRDFTRAEAKSNAIIVAINYLQ